MTVDRRTLLQTTAVTAVPAWTRHRNRSVQVGGQAETGWTVYVGGDGAVHAVDALTGEETWRASDLSGYVWSSPIVRDGTVYVGTEAGTVVALDAETGQREWHYAEPDGAVNSSPTVVGEMVYVGSTDVTLYALKADTGEPVWRYDGPAGGTWSSPAVTAASVYVGAEDDAIHALDPDTGERQWVFTAPSDPVRSSPAVASTGSADQSDEPTVYAGSHDGTVYAVNAATGEQRWAFTDPDQTVFTSPAVIGTDGNGDASTVYVGSTDTTLYAIDTVSGDSRWTYTEPERRVPSSPTVATVPGVDGSGRVLFVGTSDYLPEREDSSGAFHAVDAETGEQLWITEGFSGAIESSPTVVDLEDGIVYFGTYAGTLVALDATTGERIWVLDNLGPRIQSSPSAVPDDRESAAGSRARLQTLGHHDRESTGPLSVSDASATVGESADGDGLLGGGSLLTAALGTGTVAALVGSYALVRWLGSEEATEEVTAEHSVSEPADGAGGPPSSVPDPPEQEVTYDELTPGGRIAGNHERDWHRATMPDGTSVALWQMDPEGTVHADLIDEMVDCFDIWAKLDHEFILGVVSYGTEPVPWVATEYADGGTLADNEGGMAFDRGLWTAIAIAKAVRYAHRRGVVHGRLRPSTVHLWSIDSAWDVPKVADWGTGDPDGNRANSSPYLAPEQLVDDLGGISDRTDIYQLGVICYELFTGRHPFADVEASPVEARTISSPPSQVADVPPELDSVVLTAMALNPDDRYETVVHFRDDLQGLRPDT